MIKTLKKQKGFTLIEVLVSLTIFVVFITSVSSSYLYIAKSQREANGVREIYSDIRYLMNTITDEVRSKTIDYACYSSAEKQKAAGICGNLTIYPADSYLALIDPAGENRTVFKIDKDNETGENIINFYKEHYTGSVWVADNGFGALGADSVYRPITLKNIALKDMKFNIFPLADPFDPNNISCGPVQFQPGVSIYANVASTRTDLSKFELNIQKSVTSRAYNVQTNL